MRYPPRKKIRLPLEAYSIPGSVWLVTTNTVGRQPHFADAACAQIAVEELKQGVIRRDGRLLLYCVMPDHVHAVIQIGTVDLISIVRLYKAFVSRRCQQRGAPAEFWKERFHDRGVRQTENMDGLIKYVIENPLKAAFGDDWQAYPWTGGELLDES